MAVSWRPYDSCTTPPVMLSTAPPSIWDSTAVPSRYDDPIVHFAGDSGRSGDPFESMAETQRTLIQSIAELTKLVAQMQSRISELEKRCG